MTRRSRLQRQRDELARAFWEMRRMRRRSREAMERLAAAGERLDATLIECDQLWHPEVGEALERIVAEARPNDR